MVRDHRGHRGRASASPSAWSPTPACGTSVDRAAAEAPGTTGSWTDFLPGIVPSNILGLEGSTGDDGSVDLGFNVLQIVFIALLIGVAVLKPGAEGRAVRRVLRAFLAVIQKALWWVIRLSPIGTLGLIGNAVATYGWDLRRAARGLHRRRLRRLRARDVRRLPAAAARPRLSPLKFFSGAWPAIQLAFVSRSSVGTMPVTQ